MAWYISSDEREEPTAKNILPSRTQIWWRNQKLSSQAKVKRIQHHQTTFIVNAKGTSLDRKWEGKDLPTENKPKTIKKMVIWSNEPIKRQERLAAQMKHVHTCTSTYHVTLLDPPIVSNYFILLIMFPLRLAVVIIFYFLSGCWLWKLTNIFYNCDYVIITHLILLHHDWSTEKW